MSKVSWKSEPDEHDYPAATAYLSLIADAAQTDDLVGRLKAAPLDYHKVCGCRDHSSDGSWSGVGEIDAHANGSRPGFE